MGLFSKLFGRRKQEEETEEEGTLDEAVVFHREKLHVHDAAERKRYLQNCLDQITDASTELNSLKREYNIVTSYLTDMEEIEALPKNTLQQLRETATHLQDTTGERDAYMSRSSHMSDEQFRDLAQLEDEVESGIEKMQDAEHYQRLVKGDLKRLDNERHASRYRQHELEADTANYKGMALICFITMLVCLVVLAVLQFALQLNVKLGYIVAVCAAALAMTVLFVHYNDSVEELDRLTQDEGKLVQLQNTVKIRYVNNRHLIDYLYLKFHVTHSKELAELWQKYQAEKVDREKYDNLTKDYRFYQEELMGQLRRTRVKDPGIWLRQAAALTDNREMIEVRHQLIQRRQSLRTQMEYNRNVAQAAQNEIRDIAATYPQYADEITEMVALRSEEE